MVFEIAPMRMTPAIAEELEKVSTGQLQGEEGRAALGRMLQAALELEFAAIPVYLSAAFSHGGDNEEISQLILRAAIEEMLHFTTVANTMNAIGVPPDIRAAIPRYPCDIAIVEPPLHLELRPFSFDLVREVFLRIETPENPIEWKLAEAPPTVGQFYRAIIATIENELIPDLFAPPNKFAAVIPGPQRFARVAYRSDTLRERFPLPTDIDCRITDVLSASKHLNWLVDQGEGTSKDDLNPIDASGLPAHYYRFVSILKGKYLIADASATRGFSYSGGSLPFDPAAVHESDANPKAVDYAAHPLVREAMDDFNTNYSRLIDFLITAFHSADETAAFEAYDQSLNNMREMTTASGSIITQSKNANVRAGSPFEYVNP